MINHRQRLEDLVRTELKKVSLNSGGAGFSMGQFLGPYPTGEIGPYWLMTITIKNPMVGYTDIAQTGLIPGDMPPDQMFVTMVSALFDKCKETETQLLEKPKGLIVGKK